MRRLIIALPSLAVLVACSHGQARAYKTMINGTVQQTTVAFQTEEGRLKVGQQDVQVTFSDAAGKPVTVEKPTLTLTLPAKGGTPAFNIPVALNQEAAGAYVGTADLGTQGNWQGKVTWQQGGKAAEWGFGTMVF